MPEPARHGGQPPEHPTGHDEDSAFEAFVVAIDGPSGSGKSSVSKRVARTLGFAFLDTGAMYRSLTWWCLHQGVNLDDEDAVVAAAQAFPLSMGTDPAAPTVHVGGQDVSIAIREPAISTQVSTVATKVPVREVLRDLQRRLIAESGASSGGVVAEGRDITTVVAPDAQVRILLTASESARLARRSKELHGTADAASVAATRPQVIGRDHVDSTVSQFTVAADGVTTIDTSELDFEGSVAAVLQVIAAARA